MKNIILIIILLTTIGCLPNRDRAGRLLPDEGKIETQQKMDIKQEVRAKATIKIDPHRQPPVESSAPLNIKMLGEGWEFPANSVVELSVETNWSKSERDWYSMVGSFKVSRKMGSLLLIGAAFMAGAAILFVFGFWKLGVAAGAAGLLLISCGVAIDKYPWVFFIVILLAIVGIIYFLYQTIKAQRQELTLSKVADQIEELKRANPDLARQHITDPLANDPKAKIIRSHIERVRGLK